MKKRTKYAGFAGFESNNPKTNDLVFAVGKLILNFGAVEFLTYRLLALLDEDGTVHNAALDQPFLKRFKRIEDLARQLSMPEEVLSDIETLRSPIEKLAALRNTIAHNPIVQSWKGKDTQDESGTLGVIDIKSQKGRDKAVVNTVSLERLNLGVDAVDELARNLDSILGAVVAELELRTES